MRTYGQYCPIARGAEIFAERWTPLNIRKLYLGRPRPERYWLLIEFGDAEICKTYPGLAEDLYITAETEAFVKWHAGQLTWGEATGEGRIQLDGARASRPTHPAYPQQAQPTTHPSRPSHHDTQ